ncbi:M61 family metallopeptidase [Acidovorax sp. SRB_24]|uniref:M61 family metallopeptidase n=1 Tax=Acidovorax sp. SRB_24 TaxID=1962700 RepID=UPI00145F7D3A|nr:M61 family metallopeptidase [Acidovorax sp. SRB_24]NMM78748.1 peptidase M61 [Acidovorax sp. SRB_24]
MPAPKNTHAAVHYRVEAADLHAHLFHVTLTLARPEALQELSLPVWIPGSYLVREFAKNLQQLRARQGRRALPIQQRDKQRWQVACDSTEPLVVEYAVYANDASVRTASLNATRGFFNATSLCLRSEGQADQPCTLDIVAPENIATSAQWHCVTGLFGLETDAQGFGLYRAADYDELVDCPVEMGAFWSARFHAGGVPHRIVVAGAAPSFDGQRLVADTRKICEATIAFWHGKGKPPFKSYLFLLNAVHDGYGGLEHRNSTALICARADLPRTSAPHTGEGYSMLLGLISHEYFHTWNVKRLRPSEFRHYDYTQENYTELLWFFEGFTSYYDDLLLRRAGLIDDATYLKLLTKTSHQVLQAPGRQVQTVAQASFDAWVKYYRPDENTPNATISYYTKGALVALCLDLTLRREGATTLDDVMRALWQRCAGGPMAESDLRAVLQQLAGRAFDAELDAWVHSTAELPLAELLAAHGIALQAEVPQPAQRLGLRVAENSAVQIKAVLRGGLAERAGMAAGDEWLGIEVQGQGWRIAKLSDIALYAGAEKQVTALVARDARLLRLPLQLEPAAAPRRGGKAAVPADDTVSLGVADRALATRWLAGSAPV